MTLTTVTTTRKFFTILFSVFFFNHDLSVQQWFGVALVFTGLVIEAVEKESKHRQKSKKTE